MEPQKSELALACAEAMVVQTLGGRVHVQWDDTASATPHGQLVFFAEFLATAGLFEGWVQDCPLRYASPNAPLTRDVLGTLMLGILAGSRRYAHIAGVRGDAVAAQVLGMSKVVSEDSVRRALKAVTEDKAEHWMRQTLMHSVRQALDQPWVLDLDATIKPLFGHQQGAEQGFNPHKPGRPSHVLHTYWVGNLRLVLDAELHSGKEHTSRHGLPALERVLDELGPGRQPRLTRGDSGYGNEDVIALCERRELQYLLRLRQTSNVKRLIERVFKRDVAVTAKHEGRQMLLALPYDQVVDDAKLWEFTVLVTNTDYDLEAIGQLYRDRCDCENGFDELKNQWGWGGSTTYDMKRSQLTARAVALVYNWWSWYVRAANPGARREAITSRPLLLAAVGRSTSHGGRTTLYLTPMHAETGLIKSMIANVKAAIAYVKETAEQLPGPQRWRALLAYICARITGSATLPTPPPALPA